MSDPHRIERIEPQERLHAPRLSGAGGVLVAIGVIAFAALLLTDAPRAWGAVLAGVLAITWASVGALAFLAMHDAAGARWTAPIRRAIEGWSSGLPITAVALVALAAVGASHLYDWYASAGTEAHRHLFLSASKAAWMTPGRWIATTLGVVLVWLALRRGLVGGDGRRPRRAVLMLLLGGYGLALFTWDTVLALDSRFVSSMAGLYAAVGGLQCALALVAITAVWWSRRRHADALRAHTLHDLGTWMVGLACVWAYIALAQYVIIAFGGMDSETAFYLRRMQNGWEVVLAVGALLRFPLPFLLLLSQRARANPAALAVASAAVLAAGWLDCAWLVVPHLFPAGLPVLGLLPELAVGAGFAGGLLLLALRYWRSRGTLAHGDPDLLAVANAEHLH